MSEPHPHLGCLPLNPLDPHYFLVWSTPVTRSSDGQSYIISWTGEGATNVTYRISVNGGAEVTGESVNCLPQCRESVWTTCTASIPHVATSPFTTPVAGYQVCVVTAYGSDGTALGSLTVQRESSIVSAASMQSVYLKKMTLYPPIFLSSLNTCSKLVVSIM